MKRLHVHVTVKDLETSIGFYRMLFGDAPTVIKDVTIREVSSLGAHRETADRHVLGHATAQRADGSVSHGSAPCVE